MPEPAGIEQLFKEGFACHRAGRWQEAGQRYIAVLERQPEHPEANHLLGVLMHQNGSPAKAIPFIRRAIAGDPQFAPYHLNLGNAYQDDGQFGEAVESFRRALSISPQLSAGYFNLANALQKQGQLPAACEAYEQYLVLVPDDASACLNFAQALRQLGKTQEAQRRLEHALTINPNFADARLELGICLLGVDLHKAIEHLELFLEAKPDHAYAHACLGRALLQSNAPMEALAHCRQAVRLEPTEAEYYYTLGETLWRLQRYKLAQSALQIVLKLNPKHSEAEGLLLLASIAGRSLEEQEADELVATAQGWTNCHILFSLAQHLLNCGRRSQALAVLERLRSLNPPWVERIKAAMLLPVIIPSMEELEFWRGRFEKEVDALLEQQQKLKLIDPIGQVGRTNFYLAYHSRNDRILQRKVALIYAAACPHLLWTAPHCRVRPGQSLGGRRIKIGVVSHHLAFHTIGKLNAGWIERLSRNQFHVTVFQIPRGSRKKDPMARRIADCADRAVTLSCRLPHMREAIAAEELDLLFYTDIGMDPYTYFLAFARLAPVQCVTWGHPVTTGIPNMDYFLSSADLESDGCEDQYSEKLVRLRHVNSYYYKPQTEVDSPRTLLLEHQNRRLYVCVQSLFKLHPEFDPLLASILVADPEGLLVFISGPEPYMNAEIRRRFTRTLPSDCLDRIVFVPRLQPKQFFELLRLADVLLDTPFFGGGNTSYEAFALGAPVITWDRPLMRERITPALYRQMGVEELIAATPEEYVELAVRCANDTAWRDHVRSRILQNNHRIYENHAGVRQMERFFREAVTAAYDSLPYRPLQPLD